MPEDDYDLAGFAVGVVDKKDIINGQNIKSGDVLVGIASSGVHSNGFSLVRQVFEMTKESLDTYYDELGKTLGEALITPTRIYVKALKNIKEPVILLSHTPDIITDVPHSVNLTLAGHLHGGQIRLPQAIVVPSKFGKKFANGYYEYKGKKIYTTYGLGTSILPMRFNCPPEIVVIEFN